MDARLAQNGTGLHERVSEIRRQAGESSLLNFARSYLPAHFRLEPSGMHREVAVMLERAAIDRGARLAIAAPRGHAKSTVVCLAYVLWSIWDMRPRRSMGPAPSVAEPGRLPANRAGPGCIATAR